MPGVRLARVTHGSWYFCHNIRVSSDWSKDGILCGLAYPHANRKMSAAPIIRQRKYTLCGTEAGGLAVFTEAEPW